MTLEEARNLKAGQKLLHRYPRGAVTLKASGHFYEESAGLYPAIGAVWAHKQIRLIYLDPKTLAGLEIVT